MSKCNYCAFYSFACSSPDWQKYATDITNELRFWAEKLGRVSVPTIFFGGGTPSLMPVNIFAQILDCINTHFDIDKNCEITSMISTFENCEKLYKFNNSQGRIENISTSIYQQNSIYTCYSSFLIEV